MVVGAAFELNQNTPSFRMEELSGVAHDEPKDWPWHSHIVVARSHPTNTRMLLQ